MSDQEDQKAIAESIRTMRPITGVMILGLLLFLLVVVLVKWESQPEEGQNQTVLLVVFLSQAFLTTLIALFFPGQLLDRKRKELVRSLGASQRPAEIPTSSLLNMLRGASIMRLALLEATGLTLVIATLNSGQFWLLPVAGAIIGLMVREWPTVESVSRPVVEQRDRIRQDF